MPTTKEAVSSIAAFFADLEKDQRKAMRKARQLRDEYQAIHDNGSAGPMATMTAFAQLDAHVTGQYAATLALHMEQTATAEGLGIDAGPLPAIDPGEGGITILGGGDRLT